MERSGAKSKPTVEFDPSGEAITKLLHSWVRSEMAFRGRQIDRVHTNQDGTGIDRVRYLVLRQLFRDGPRRLTDLAEVVSLTPSHTSRLVDSLVKQGLLVRTVPDGDRRVTVISVSEAGRDLMASFDAQSRQLIADRLSCAGFTAAEAARFGEYFDRFAAEVGRWAASVRTQSDDTADRDQSRPH